MQQMLSREFEGFATNSGFMGANKTSKAYKGFQQGRYWDLENSDVDRVRRSVNEVDIITPSLAKWGVDVIYNEQKISGTLKGLYPEYGKIEEPMITYGRYLNDMDVKDRRRVCVIGKTYLRDAFSRQGESCGRFIKINGIYYQVIGVSVSIGEYFYKRAFGNFCDYPFHYDAAQTITSGKRCNSMCYTARKGYSNQRGGKDKWHKW